MKIHKYLFKNFSKKYKIVLPIRGPIKPVKYNKTEYANNKDSKDIKERESLSLISKLKLELNYINKEDHAKKEGALIKYYFTNKNDQVQPNETSLLSLLSINSDKKAIENMNSHLEVIAEIKSDLYSILKIVRTFSFYFITPFNCLLALYSFETMTMDLFVSQALSSFALVILPYIFTENFVINMKYDRKRDQLHITKMNFYCKLSTRVYNVRNLVRVHRKYNLRFFSFFKDKSTNEYFSIIKICKIKNTELLNYIIPEKELKGKRKDDINQRLIDVKMNKSERNLNFVKFYLVAYLIITVSFLYYQFKKYKTNISNDFHDVEQFTREQ